MELVKLRSLASDILAEVIHHGATLEESVTKVLTSKSKNTFPEFERSWIFDVTSGVLRYLGRIDFIINTYSLKKKPTGELRRLLQISIFQILYQDAPDALIVSETVQAIRKLDGEQPGKFANALLRRVSAAKEDWKNWNVTEATPFDEQVAWCSLPEWLFKKLRKDHGSDWVFAFSQAILERPRIWYRTREKMIMLEKGFQGNEPDGFVQDISNQMVVDEVVKTLKKRFQNQPKILDLCSAPGGKSLGLAFQGYTVDATDVSSQRMQRVLENRSRLQLEDIVTVRDYGEILVGEEKFDVIWIDAPCSSTGIMRRHPEIKWNRTWADIEKYRLAQEELLKWATTHLTENGVVIYSTCSMLAMENQIIAPYHIEKEWKHEPQTEPFGDGIYAAVLTATDSK